MSLEGKVVVVAGGARDIGRAISVYLAAQGAKVVVNYFGSEAGARETLGEITQAGGEGVLCQGDMTIESDVIKLAQAANQAFGPKIDALVNVVGGLLARKTLEELDLEFFQKVMNLNMTSTFLLTKVFVPLMPEGSAIVNFSSQAARDGGGPGASIYATSKGAVTTFTRAMSKELGPKGIRVNALCCGMISTTFHDTFTKDEVRKNVAAGTPLRREGQAQEVAQAVAFLASDESSFITGVNMDVNGGLFFS